MAGMKQTYSTDFTRVPDYRRNRDGFVPASGIEFLAGEDASGVPCVWIYALNGPNRRHPMTAIPAEDVRRIVGALINAGAAAQEGIGP